METVLQQIDINTILQIVTVLVLLASLRWQLPSKDDIQRLDRRIDKLESKMDERFLQQESKMDERFLKVDERFLQVDERFSQQDAKLDALRLEMKADMQRLEDKLERANEYHARSVDLLDAIRRGVEGRREPL
ncbi:MAG: hypothetical protein OXE46_12305 [Chloroflexi bacterium]|nr:hypothetical protein [Chloroflexota bacterium]